MDITREVYSVKKAKNIVEHIRGLGGHVTKITGMGAWRKQNDKLTDFACEIVDLHRKYATLEGGGRFKAKPVSPEGLNEMRGTIYIEAEMPDELNLGA